jgi:hypothetical protein
VPPREELLSDNQPSDYVFGVLLLASLAVIGGSGTILALKGPRWWRVTGVLHLFNSIHLWAVEPLFFFMVIHLWGSTGWRHGAGRCGASGSPVRSRS